MNPSRIRAIVGGLMLLGGSIPIAGAEGMLSYGPPGGPESQRLEIGAAAVRMSRADSASWLLYRDDEQAIYIVDDAQRSYQRVDRSAAESIMAQIKRLQAEVERQLAALPPDQREMMRSMMPKVPEFTPGSYRLDVQENEGKAAGYACKNVIVYRDESAVEEMCLSRVKALGLVDQDMQMLKRMGGILSQVAANFGADAMATVLEKVEGIPVEHRDPGARQAKLQLLKVQSGTQPERRFSVPQGYQQQSLGIGLAP